jgi:glycolate oxidase
MEKDHLMPFLFSAADLALMTRVHDAFNPDGRLNPGKIFPSSKACGEIYARPASAVAVTSPKPA